MQPGIIARIEARLAENGLGLDLARRIVVEKHHGDLRVKSEPGHTKFIVLLPLVAPAPEMPTPIELPATAE